METKLKYLNRISKIKAFEPKNYYTIYIDCFGVKLQGNFDSKLVTEIKKFIPNPIIKDRGYMEFEKNILRIVLT